MFTFVDLLSSVAGTAGQQLKNLLMVGGGPDISEAEAKERGVEFVLVVLNKSYSGAKDQLIKWFASLTEMTVDEFLAAPPETVLDVMDELISRPESVSFFKRAVALFSKTLSSSRIIIRL
ncbi:MAG: hypothetical protein LBC59_09440 [Chitinispirillales bacterium]|nr:hypothetical protein [Chitinispirillales bacterium]